MRFVVYQSNSMIDRGEFQYLRLLDTIMEQGRRHTH